MKLSQRRAVGINTGKGLPELAEKPGRMPEWYEIEAVHGNGHGRGSGCGRAACHIGSADGGPGEVDPDSDLADYVENDRLWATPSGRRWE